MLGHCGLCWHTWLEVQQHNSPDANRMLFFPPELEDNMMNARREAYQAMVAQTTAAHMARLNRVHAQERRDQEADTAQEAVTQAREQARRQTAADEEDTFVLSHWVANKHIYIYI